MLLHIKDGQDAIEKKTVPDHAALEEILDVVLTEKDRRGDFSSLTLMGEKSS